MNHPLARTKDLVIQELKEEILVCDMETFRYCCLNRTSAEVWRLCDGKTDVRQITGLLARKLHAPVKEDLVWLALEELSKARLLVNNMTAQHLFHNLSRRAVIRRMGIASAISLPIISSLTMPLASNAQSLPCFIAPFPIGCPCQDDSDCANGGCLNGACGQAEEVPFCPCQGQCDCFCDPFAPECPQCTCCLPDEPCP